MALVAKEVEKRFEEHHSRIKKIEVDVYYGDGVENPSMTTRMDRVEQAISTVNKLTWAVILGIIAVIGDIVQHHVTH